MSTRRHYRERDDFWTLGDVSRSIFLGSKDNGPYPGETCVDVNCLELAEKFVSYREAREAMRDEDIREWIEDQGNPEGIRPLYVKVTMEAVQRGRPRERKEDL